MSHISLQLLQTVSQEITGIPASADDLTAAASQFGAQLEGLARLDNLDLLEVEPATVLLPPTEVLHGER